MPAPTLVKEIPSQTVNERAAYGPFDLTDFIGASEGEALRFEAGTVSGASLPRGMICTADGLLTGIPAKGTQGSYEILVHAENEAGSVEAKFMFFIQSSLIDKHTQEYTNDLKQKIWQALENSMPIPDMKELLERAITPLDIYYLLERWSTLTIYNAFDLNAPGEKKLLELEGVSEHYQVYDRGCCLVACPKDLFSHERTLADGIRTAEALAREAYKRDWPVELTGFEKLTRAAWLEIMHLGDQHNKKLEIINYQASETDYKLYDMQAEGKYLRASIE